MCASTPRCSRASGAATSGVAAGGSGGDGASNATPSWRRNAPVAFATPSQMNRFFDACTDWLLASGGARAGDADSDATTRVQSTPLDARERACVANVSLQTAPGDDGVAAESDPRRIAHFHNLGYSHDDAWLAEVRPCLVCREWTASHAIGNPFARAHLLALCASCSTTLQRAA